MEAISRGASRGVFVESEPAAFRCLRKNVDSLGAAEAEILLLDYRQALRRLRGRSMRFDLVFLDPPYGKGLAGASAAGLSRAGLVGSGGTVVVEESVRAPDDAFPEGWTLSADRRYGDTRVMLFRV